MKNTIIERLKIILNLEVEAELEGDEYYEILYDDAEAYILYRTGLSSKVVKNNRVVQEAILLKMRIDYMMRYSEGLKSESTKATRKDYNVGEDSTRLESLITSLNFVSVNADKGGGFSVIRD